MLAAGTERSGLASNVDVYSAGTWHTLSGFDDARRGRGGYGCVTCRCMLQDVEGEEEEATLPVVAMALHGVAEPLPLRLAGVTVLTSWPAMSPFFTIRAASRVPLVALPNRCGCCNTILSEGEGDIACSHCSLASTLAGTTAGEYKCKDLKL